MRPTSSKAAKEALEPALHGLEGVIMTLPNDPKLSELKADIRRAIAKPRTEKRKTARINKTLGWSMRRAA